MLQFDIVAWNGVQSVFDQKKKKKKERKGEIEREIK